MIINQRQDTWEVIYHRGHALLAAKLAARWSHSDRPARLIESIAAIFNHDDLEREWEGNHLGPNGMPLDFTLNEKLEVDKIERLVEGASYRARFVALLTSMHVSFLFEPMRGNDKKLDTLLDDQTVLQKSLRSALKLKKGEVEQDYAFMQWCDRLSLILARRELPERERRLEISKGPDGRRYDILQREDETITVEPWPFEDDAFTVDLEAAYLTKIIFEDNAELTAALKAAEVHTLEWRFVRG
ncbi:MAG: DUF3891 family protein [Roseiflexaceae bacterium]|nr:DUF3891 family protein [Roseiflexaceae bacterium]